VSGHPRAVLVDHIEVDKYEADLGFRSLECNLPPESTSVPYSTRHNQFSTAAMSDSVASNSSSLCAYMKNYPTTLVAYVKYFGNIEDNVTTAEMSSIDLKVSLG
jgi:hypothetical protein